MPSPTSPTRRTSAFSPAPRAAFLARHAGIRDRPGDIVDRRGVLLGRHLGHHHFTVGQRRGLGSPRPTTRYVLADRRRPNIVTVGPREALATSRCALRDVRLRGSRRWWSLRYRSTPVACSLRGDEVGLVEPVDGVAPGQTAVFLAGDLVVGTATIARAAAISGGRWLLFGVGAHARSDVRPRDRRRPDGGHAPRRDRRRSRRPRSRVLRALLPDARRESRFDGAMLGLGGITVWGGFVVIPELDGPWPDVAAAILLALSGGALSFAAACSYGTQDRSAQPGRRAALRRPRGAACCPRSAASGRSCTSLLLATAAIALLAAVDRAPRGDARRSGGRRRGVPAAPPPRRARRLHGDLPGLAGRAARRARARRRSR